MNPLIKAVIDCARRHEAASLSYVRGSSDRMAVAAEMLAAAVARAEQALAITVSQSPAGAENPTAPATVLFDPALHKPPGGSLLCINPGGVLIIGPWRPEYLAWGYKPRIPATVKAKPCRVPEIPSTPSVEPVACATPLRLDPPL